MKAVTLWAPWAWAIVLGRKHVVTKPDDITHRGVLHIHALRAIPPEWRAKAEQRLATPLFQNIFRGQFFPASHDRPVTLIDIPAGGIIGAAWLDTAAKITGPAMRTMIEAMHDTTELRLDDFRDGRTAASLSDPLRYKGIIPCAGPEDARYLWDVPDYAVTGVRASVAALHADPETAKTFSAEMRRALIVTAPTDPLPMPVAAL